MNRAMNRVTHARILSLAVLATFTACSGGGGSSTTGSITTGGSFLVLQTDPVTNGRLYLNDPIQVDFSKPVALESANLNTVSFQVFDQLGNAVSEQVAGDFFLAKSPGDAVVGRRLQFVPRFPTNNTFDNGGFKPGRRYLVQLVGGNRLNGTVLRDQTGKPLAVPVSFQFSTADGTAPTALFRNTVAGGPRRAALDLTPTPDSTGLVLNKQGQAPVEVRLKFDQALNPSTTNLPVALDNNPLLRNVNNRGRVFLEYDDPDPAIGTNAWIPADVELESNSLSGATLVLRPVGVLPNNATIRVIVESSLEDISGESNVANASYDRVFGTFQTKRAYEQQFDAIVEEFSDASALDLSAPFGEPVADVGPGYIKAGFAFEGTATNLEYEPAVQQVILNTNFTQVTPKAGVPYNVSGGVFNFKNVKIPQGVTVRGQGTNPMVWLVSGTFEVAGNLSVRGGDGEKAMSLASANFPKAGGYGACGGGDGGAGSPSSTQRDLAGATGNGPLQQALKGGTGGKLSYAAGCNRGSGGGGGALATQGDPHYRQKTQPAGTTPLPVFQQQTGLGGPGCTGAAGNANRQLDGGQPGAVVFVDSREDNNFWGSAINYREGLRIAGELSVPIGGGGGGGGGDLSYNGSSNVNDVNFSNDGSGGAGGGGGGVLIVKALGDIIIRSTGHISADGGSGGGGEQSGACTKGGGGGAGSGGMVILMSATRIEVNVHGLSNSATLASDLYSSGTSGKDYDFAISADGGVTTTGTFSAPIVVGKYPNRGVECVAPATYDSAPLGGFGGMGIVQLMAPPGTNADNTNTVLDDNVRVIWHGTELTGTSKQQALAWRGFPNSTGVLVDDNGNATNIGDNEGDIRPSPMLMPTPFSAKSRLRTKWIDTGRSARRPLVADDGLPRGIVEQGGSLAGPTYEFLGTNPSTGYASFSSAGGEAVKIDYPITVAAQNILSMDAGATFLDQPAYRVQLETSLLGTVADRYSQYEAELLDASDIQVGSFRILSHTERSVVLSPNGAALPSTATQLRVVGKLFEIVTGGAPGLGATYPGSVGGTRVPISNVRIGFAFHRNPANATATRYPATAGTYLYNLSDTAVQEAIRVLGAPFVQMDILFDCAFKSTAGDAPPALSPSSPRPELHSLRVPFRF